MKLIASKIIVLLLIFTSCFNSNSISIYSSEESGGPVMVKSVPAFIDMRDEDENTVNAAWRLFDGMSGSSLTVNKKTGIYYTLNDTREIAKIKTLSTSAGKLSIFLNKKEEKRKKSIAEFCIKAGPGWQTFFPADTVEARNLLLEFTPESGVFEILEIEVWVKESRLPSSTLEGVGENIAPGNIIARHQSNIFTYTAGPYELAIGSNSGMTGSGNVYVDVPVPPSVFRRVYLAYDEQRRASDTGVSRSINSFSWLAGFTSTENSPEGPEWDHHLEEINPGWLVHGINRIDFKADGDTSVKNIRIIAEAGNGWNSILDCSVKAICDTDTTLSEEIDTFAEIDFERSIGPEHIMIHVPSPQAVTAGVQYLTERGWENVGSNFIIDFSEFEAGWNAVRLPVKVTTDSIRFLFSGKTFINEVLVSASPAGSDRKRPRIIVSYPRNSEYCGDMAKIDGFVIPADRITGLGIEERRIDTNPDSGSFSMEISRDDTRFRSRGSDMPWYVEILASFGYKENLVKAVHLSENICEGKSSEVDNSDTGSDNPESDSPDETVVSENQYRTIIKPQWSKSITYKNVTLEIPAGAVEEETEITIVPLSRDQIERLNPGMVNVTFPAAGYRFLPNRTFRKDITVKFGYSDKLLLPGQKDDNINMFYHHDGKKKWKRLERIEVDRNKKVIVSRSNHFTDIINATLIVPEHPDPLKYNPNAIKEIKAGDPASGIVQIGPPRANSSGDASLSYPLIIPKGRAGMRPDAQIRYGSSAGNGWLGMGWDFPIDSITIDTRWGVPRYNGTEIYLLNGKQLTYDTAGGFYRTRVEGGFFRIRRSGTNSSNYWWEVTDKSGKRYIYGQNSQARLASYKNGNIFQWCLERVIDSNGNSIVYQYQTVRETDYKGERGVQIYPEQITYTGYEGVSSGVYGLTFQLDSGNRPDKSIDCRSGFKVVTAHRLLSIDVRFKGDLIRRYGLEYRTGPFYKTLLKKIVKYDETGARFTEHALEYYNEVDDESGNINGFSTQSISSDAYRTSERIILNQERTGELGGTFGDRKGFSIYAGFALFNFNKRGSIGFKLGGDLSEKKVLQSFIDVDGDGLPDQVYRKGGSIYYIPNQRTDDGKFIFDRSLERKIEGLSGYLGSDRTMNLVMGAQVYWGGGGGFYDHGFGFVTGDSYFSDVNGDGLVDFVSGGRVLFNDQSFDAAAERFIPGYSSGAPSYLGSGSPDIESIDLGVTKTREELVKNYYRDNPILVWRAPFSGMVRISGAAVLLERSRVENIKQLEYMEDYGIEPGAPGALPEYDGVTINIQKGESLIWSEILTCDEGESGEETCKETKPYGVEDVWMHAGEEIFFWADSIDVGAADMVRWDPEIEYLGVDSSPKDENERYIYRYRASEGFSLAGTEKNWSAFYSGESRIDGRFYKKSVTSDNVTVTIKRNSTDILYERTFGANEIAAEGVDISIEGIDLTVDREGEDPVRDSITCSIHSDTSVDLTKLSWKPTLTYTSIDDESLKDKDTQEEKVQIKPENLSSHLPLSITSYPVPDDDPAAPWRVPRSGTIKVEYSVQKLEQSYDVPDNPFDPYNDNSLIGSGEMPDDYEARITFAAKKRNELLAKESGIITKSGENDIKLDLYIDVTEGDEIFFVTASNKYDIVRYTMLSEPKIIYSDIGCAGPPEDCGYTGDAEDPTAMLYHAADPEYPFSGGHRGWYYARYNGEKTIAGGKLDPELMKRPDIGLDTSAGSETELNQKLEDQMESKLGSDPADDEMFRKLSTFSGMRSADRHRERWAGNDPDCFIGYITENDTELFVLSATRVGKKYIPAEGELGFIKQQLAAGSETGNGASGAVRAPGKLTRSSYHGAGGSVMGAGGCITSGTSETYIDYFDFNGDRFPDMISQSRIQFTAANGALGATRVVPGYGATVRSSESRNTNFSAGIGGGAPSISYKDITADGVVTGQTPESPAIGFSGNAGDGTTTATGDFIDVNGDGLPDRVYVQGNVKVRLNYGYRLGPEIDWDGDSSFRVNETQSIGGGLGFSIDKMKFAGGVGLANSKSKVTKDYLDINGDGLADKVWTSGDGVLRARLNRGSDLGPTIEWRGGGGLVMTSDDAKQNNASGYFGISIPIFIPVAFVPVWIGSIQINPGGNYMRQVGRAGTRIQDINGDGLPDQIQSGDNDTIKAWLNRTGKTNLLKTVTRPLGGAIEIKYTRSGNTPQMPQSRWTLSGVTVRDGMEGLEDGESAHTYTTAYSYADGFYSRIEREFCGFGAVETRRADGSRITGGYYTDFYRKGIERKSVFRDSSDRIYTVKNTTVESASIFESGAYPPQDCKFPKIVEEESFLYEGSATQERESCASAADGCAGTVGEYAYDEYGNITRFTDYGDSGTEDDVTASVTYAYSQSSYIMNRPLVIQVNGSDGTLYRERIGLYDRYGNLKELKRILDGDIQSTTSMSYDRFGNILRVTGPANHRGQRYRITYTYETETDTHIQQTEDSFGYRSTAQYDYKYGLPRVTADTGNNKIYYSYDRKGRLRELIGPYDKGTTLPTIEIVYSPPVKEDRYPNNIISPAHALVRNKADRDSTRTIDTITYIDGLSRVIQVRKTSEVRHQAGMTISGAVVYDALARVVKQGQPGFVPGQEIAFTPQPLKNPASFEYDAAGRKTVVDLPYDDGESKISYYYAIAGEKLSTTIVDQNLKTRKMFRDMGGSVTSVSEKLDGLWTKTRYEYNPLNEITRVVDDKGNVTEIVYDNFGRRTAIDNPDTGLVEYSYDNAGNLINKITPNLRAQQKMIKYVYDCNRLEKVVYPFSDSVIYAYGQPTASWNRAGRITSVETGDMREERFYGRLGETVKVTRSIKVSQPEPAWKTYTTRYSFDSMGRMKKLTWPDGEVLSYVYDAGGLLRRAFGRRGSAIYNYVNDIEYDEYGRRAGVKYGNGITTAYTYNETTGRLERIESRQGETVIQNISYDYDKAGNILKKENRGFSSITDSQLTLIQEYAYDDLHRLVSSTGSYGKSGTLFDTSLNSYTSAFEYDTIGNILKKEQVNILTDPDNGNSSLHPEKTYTLNYEYNHKKPHAVSFAGVRDNDPLFSKGKAYEYDANGNMTSWLKLKDMSWRQMIWDEENRLRSSIDNVTSTGYSYDYSGQRIIKKGAHGEAVYVNPNYTVRNGEIATKHVFAGNIRVCSKVSSSGEEKGTYFYAGDHLGSSNFVSDESGKVSEHLEYFPYGESWFEERASADAMAFKYTGKELDPETGLYYFGARYYDARLSRWVSVDPAFQNSKYFPKPNDFDMEHGYFWYHANDKTQKLPGIGGVFNAVNLDLYHYAGNNPIKYVDPDGNYLTETYLNFGDTAHQDAIAYLLGNQVNPSLLAAMQDQQILIDKFQDNADQYIHAMTGEGQSRSEAISKAETFVWGWLNRAIAGREGGDNENSARAFSNALHTVQDATSPSHKGFQRWDSNTDKYNHLMQEKNYPTGDSRQELESSTQWLYDIYKGKEQMPKRFFDPNSGHLVIPQKYLKGK